MAMCSVSDVESAYNTKRLNCLVLSFKLQSDRKPVITQSSFPKLINQSIDIVFFDNKRYTPVEINSTIELSLVDFNAKPRGEK